MWHAEAALDMLTSREVVRFRSSDRRPLALLSVA
jgi:hypothetical protein